MTFARTRFRHILPFALLAGVALVPAGCGGDEGVHKYDAPKTTDATPKVKPAAGEYRLLALMIPADKPEWFIKYPGTAEDVTKYQDDFDKLAASLQLGGTTLDYTPPEGWKKGPGRTMVQETIVTADGKQEMTVSQVAGGVEQNLSRWVGQIGQKAGADDVTKYTKVIDGKGVKVRRVDLRGPNDPATKRGPMVGGK